MAKYVFIENELKPHEKIIGECEGRLVDFLKTKPLINPEILLNDKPLFKDGIPCVNDDYILKDNDSLVIVNTLKGGLGIGAIFVKLLISTAISYALNALLAPDKPSIPKQAEQEKAVTEFTINTSQNQARNGTPIPECFGTYVRTPDIVSSAYRRYENNKEYLYMLLCLGVGQNTVNEIFIEDTSVDTLNPNVFFSRLYKTESEHTGNDKIKDDWEANVPLGTYVLNDIEYNPIEEMPLIGSVDYLIIDLKPEGQDTNILKLGCQHTRVFPQDDDFRFYWEINLYKNNVFIKKEERNVKISNIKSGRNAYPSVELNFPIGEYDEARVQSRVTQRDRPSTIYGTFFLKTYTYSQINTVPDPYFRDIVITSKEVESVKLVNDSSDAMEFIKLNPNDTTTDFLEFDILLNGLYYQENDSSLSSRTVNFDFVIRDSSGAETTFSESITDATNSQIRRSFNYNVAPDTYDIKVLRITADNTNTRVQDDIYLERAKAYIVNNDVTGDEYVDYGDVTLLAVKIKATEGISAKGQFKVKVNATRDGLEQLDDIMNYVWTAQNGGKQDPNGLSLPLMDEPYNSVMENRTTVFKTLQSVASSRRYNFFPSFNIMTARKDIPQPIRTMMFNEANIVKNSLKITTSAKDVTDYDGVRTIFRDPTSFENEFAVFPTDASFPQDVELDGVTDAEFALEQAEFLYKQDLYRNVKYQFDTELDGHVPTYNDRVGLAHPVIAKTQSGIIVGKSPLTNTVELNEVVKEDYTNMRILFRDRLGVPSALYTVIAMNKRTLTLDSALPSDLYVGDDEQKTIYTLGEGTEFIDDLMVIGIRPKSNNLVTITAYNYNENIY